MSKKIYIPDGENIARRANKIYIPVDGVAHKVKKIYVGDAENKARQCFSSEYKWTKYVSKKTGSAYRYEDMVIKAGTKSFGMRESPPSSDWYNYPDPDDHSEWYLKVYKSINYGHITGIIEGSGNMVGMWCSMYGNVGIDTADSCVGGYIINLAGTEAWRIKDYSLTSGMPSYLRCDTQYKPGARYQIYSYTYENKGIVTSYDENAYTDGAIGDYTSRDSNDIRTVYIRVVE